jgi:hypothetical protein
MGPLGVLFLARTVSPATLLREQPQRFFARWSMGGGRCDFTAREEQGVRPPVAAAVFDCPDRRGAAPQVSARVARARRPGRPAGRVTKLAVPLEPPPEYPPFQGKGFDGSSIGETGNGSGKTAPSRHTGTLSHRPESWREARSCQSAVYQGTEGVTRHRPHLSTSQGAVLAL